MSQAYLYPILGDRKSPGGLADTERALAALRQHDRELEIQKTIKNCFLEHAVLDLRALLVPVRGYARLVCDGRTGNINSIQREYLGILLGNVEKIVRLSERWQRAAAEAALHFERVDLAALLCPVLDRVLPQAAARDIRMERAVGFPLVLWADVEKLADALEQLLCYALRLAAAGSSCRVELLPRYAAAVLVVSITSVHISPEIHDMIWEPDAASPLGRVYQAIDSHGGRLSAAVNKESQFRLTVELPAIELEDADPDTRR